jgi:ribonuclease-3
MQTDFSILEKKLDIHFKDKNLLMQAFIHRSYLNENGNIKVGHNERLEFLGDAVLELIVTDHLYTAFPQAPEGELTAYRSSLVNTQLIGGAASDIGMNEYLLLSKGESKDIGKARMHILANTFESFIGALFLDQGYDACQKFVARVLFPKLDEIVHKKLWRDSKSLVQEKAQEIYHVTPSYKVLHESGPDHDKKFTIGIYFGNDMIAQGKGKSKQEAEQSAARAAIEEKKWMD